MAAANPLWTVGEHEAFLAGLAEHGMNWRQVRAFAAAAAWPRGRAARRELRARTR